jgi:microcystin-dependent protein
MGFFGSARSQNATASAAGASAPLSSAPLLGEIRMFAGNFAPAGWALCDGQLLSIRENTALFSLLGTSYGGDGLSTFALPDLRGRVPLHAGAAPGLPCRALGESGGGEPVRLAQENAMEEETGTAVDQAEVSPAMQPFLCVHFIIALQGAFPSR